MLSLLIYDRDKEECQMLLHNSEQVVAYCSNENMKKIVFENEESVNRFMKEHNLLDAAFMEVTKEEGIDLTKHIRKSYKESELLLISDESVSPMKYITPDIRAASLLVRPFTNEEREQIIGDFFHAFFRERTEALDGDRRLILNLKEGTVSIPFMDIYYIEVQKKKIYIRLKYEEYCKYASLESIEGQLPSYFFKCHRSFIVNENYISRVRLSENSLFLENGVCIPVSRTYKSDVKERIERKKILGIKYE